MDLEQFRTLVAVAETGGISSDARRRHLSQPAVSLQIKALEQELGRHRSTIKQLRSDVVEATQAQSRRVDQPIGTISEQFNPRSLRRVILLNEVIGPPTALREPVGMSSAL